MNQHTKKQLNLWWTWNYEKQQHRLDALSERGMHLVKPGVFRGEFAVESKERYIYRLDYQPNLRKKELMEEYLHLYHDAGWEYVGECYGWQHFRRAYGPGAQPEIYSDKESLQQHYRRIQRVLFAVLVAEAIVLSVNVNNYFTVSSRLHHVAPVFAALFVLLGVVILLLAHGCIVLSGKMRRIRQPNP